MAKTKFIMEAEEAKVVQALLKILDGQKKVENQTRKINKESKKTNQLASKFISGLMGMAAGVASIATIKQAFAAVGDEIRKAMGLQKEFLEVTLTVEQASQKLAHVRKDVSGGGLAQATADIRSLSTATGVTPSVAKEILFFSESALGGRNEKSQASAMGIAQFAGPADLTPEEVKLLPKLFNITKADTSKKQMAVLNQVLAASGGSIAETGEFLRPYISMAGLDIERGVPLAESLAKMTSMIELSGSIEKAATAGNTAIEIARGGQPAAAKLLRGEAKKRNQDYDRMSVAEQLGLVEDVYKDYTSRGQANKLQTVFSREGFRAFEMMFSDAASSKFDEILPKILAAPAEQFVQKMAEQFGKSLTAKTTNLESRGQFAKAKTGQENAARVMLEKMVDEIQSQTHAMTTGFGESMALAFTTNAGERNIIRGGIVEENLNIALNQATDPARRKRLSGLQHRFQTDPTAMLSQKFLRDVAGETDDFMLPTTGQMTGNQGTFVSAHGDAKYFRAFERFFENGGAPMSEATGKEIVGAINNLANKLDGSDVIPTGIGMQVD